MKHWKEDVRGIGGLDYIVFKGVPMRESKFGDVIDFNPGLLEKIAAEAVISHRVPLRGLEVRFLRKTSGLTLDAFAKSLDLTAAAVRKWELKEKERLHPINEAAVRAFFAEKLGVEFPGKLSELVGRDKAGELVLKAG
jgi:DNA-binding transcriptional regulator YiaG